MPDGIVATPPSGFVMTSSYDATDSDGEIDIEALADGIHLDYDAPFPVSYTHLDVYKRQP